VAEDLFRGGGISLQTQEAVRRLDEELAPLAPAAVLPASGQTGLSKRPLTAQEALQRGDPKLLEALRRRNLGAVPQPVPQPPLPAVGYGAVQLKKPIQE